MCVDGAQTDNRNDAFLKSAQVLINLETRHLGTTTIAARAPSSSGR